MGAVYLDSSNIALKLRMFTWKLKISVYLKKILGLIVTSKELKLVIFYS